jgi:hypothetical protein
VSTSQLTADYVLQSLQGVDALIRKSATPVLGLEVVRQDLENELKLAANLDTPLRNRMKRIKGEGKAHAFYQLQSNLDSTGQVRFLGTDATNGVFAKGGLPNSVDAQYNYIARPYANVGDVMTIPFQDIAQDASYIEIKAQQKRVKMLNTGLIEEYLIINGNSDTTSGLEFDGLLTQILNGGYNILDVSAAGGSPLRYSLITQELFRIKKAGGRTRALIMSYSMKAALTELLGLYYAIRQVGTGGGTNYAGGFSTESWDFGTGSVDLIDDQYMIPDPVTGLERIIFIDDETPDDKNGGNVIQMVDVDPIHYQDLATIATAERGIVYETTQLMIGILQFQGLITGFNLSLTPTIA